MNDTPVSSLDLFPTILKACGVPLPKDLPGIDLTDAAAVKARKTLTGECFTHNFVDQEKPASSLRWRWILEDGWKLIVPAPQNEKGEPELYQVSGDPTRGAESRRRRTRARRRAACETRRMVAGKIKTPGFFSANATIPNPSGMFSAKSSPRPSKFLLLLLVLTIQSAAGSNRKPNVILIMADDLGYGSLGCYGSKEVHTPNIDQLAARGMRFTDFHSNGPMCSPTRVALLTGRYPQRCAWVGDEELSPVFREQRNNNLPQRWAWGISANEWTIAELFQQAGYHTGILGKWHLGYDSRFHPMNQGFDEFRGFVGGNVDYHTHVAGYGLKQLDWWNGRQIENEAGYTTDLLTRHATDFITRHKDKPFFLYLAHAAPHDPLQGRDPENKKSPAETYREMIEILDESVGAVTRALRENQLEENTLVIFCSDNGAAAPRGVPANGRLKGRKGSMNEGGHRVPFIASWPGVIPAGSTPHDTAMTMDFFPTFAKLVGAKPPEGLLIDGTDIMPLLKDSSSKIDRDLHWLFGDSWAVRQGSWKLMGKGREALTLVNLENDIEEKINLLKEQPERVDALMTLHRQWIKSVGDR